MVFLAAVLFAASQSCANDSRTGSGHGVHRFVLPNGMQLVVALRPELRLAAVNLTVNIGSVDDPPQQSGMAHVLEHVTLSGSTTVGSLDPQTEASALAQLDRAYAALERERQKAEPNPTVIAGLERVFEQAQQLAMRKCETGEILGGRLEAHGAVGLNATTAADATQFFTWIPVEDIEVWIELEAARLRHPILRRFYRERNVVLREVAGLTGGHLTPQERLLQEIFPGAPVGQPLAGDLNQIGSIERPAAFNYFHRYYRPGNMVIAIVGNVDPKQMYQLCMRYFADWRPQGKDVPSRSRLQRAPELSSPVVRNFNGPQMPVVFLAFPHSATTLLEAAASDALMELINSEDLSPLRRRLVEDEASAWDVGAVADYPSHKQASVFLVHVYGNRGVSHDVLAHETSALLKALQDSSDEDLRGAILSAEMRLATQLDDAPTLASLLAFNQAVLGDWSLSFQRVETLRQLQVSDVRAFAHKLFDQLYPDNIQTSGR